MGSLGSSGSGGQISSMGNYGNTGPTSGMAGPLGSGRFSVPGTAMGMDMHRIPIIGNMFPNPADQFKQQQMQNAAAAYSMYRPEAMQAYMNAMNSQSASLQPMNNALAAMYGSGATSGFEAQNPFGASAFFRGAATGTNPLMPARFGEQPQGGAAETPPAQIQGGVFSAPNQDFYRPWEMGTSYGNDSGLSQETLDTQGQYGAYAPNGIIYPGGSPTGQY